MYAQSTDTTPIDNLKTVAREHVSVSIVPGGGRVNTSTLPVKVNAWMAEVQEASGSGPTLPPQPAASGMGDKARPHLHEEHGCSCGEEGNGEAWVDDEGASGLHPDPADTHAQESARKKSTLR